MKGKFGFLGHVFVYKNGVLVHDQKNLIVDAGLTFSIRGLLVADQGRMTHLGIGSGTNDTAAQDTALQTQLARAAFKIPPVGSNGDKTFDFSSEFGKGIGTGTINEAGIFSAATAGVMFSRVRLATPVSKGPDDVVEIAWKLTVGRI